MARYHARVLTLLRTAILIVATALVACREEQRTERPARPNVVVISVCSVRADHTSLNGYARRTTPNLEALARDSVVFDQAVTQWPKTVPAMAALLTGRYGHSTGVMRVTTGQHLPDEELTIAEHFRKHGYATGAFLSTAALHHGTNLFQGFDVVEETYRSPQPFARTTTSALEWIRKAQRPFLVWAFYTNAHHPYHAPDAPPGLFVGDAHYDGSVKMPLNDANELALAVPKDHPFRDQILRPDMYGVRKEVRLPEHPRDLAFYVARYDAGIFGADRRIGELLRGIADLMPNTIVVVVGDHGESLGDQHYYFGHGRLPYDPVARVPFLIRPSGGQRPRRVAQPVPTFSLFPTVVDLAGLPQPLGIEAPSLAPLLRGGEGPARVYTESGYALDFQLAVRDERWKLIYVPDALDRSLMTGSDFELYDLATDPHESRNVFDANPDQARRLKYDLLTWSQPWRARARVVRPGLAGPIDSQTEKQLRSLGYIR